MTDDWNPEPSRARASDTVISMHNTSVERAVEICVKLRNDRTRILLACDNIRSRIDSAKKRNFAFVEDWSGILMARKREEQAVHRSLRFKAMCLRLSVFFFAYCWLVLKLLAIVSIIVLIYSFRLEIYEVAQTSYSKAASFVNSFTASPGPDNRGTDNGSGDTTEPTKNDHDAPSTPLFKGSLHATKPVL